MVNYTYIHPKGKTGDRILEVDGIDVRTSSHEQAVDIIRAAGNPVRLLIQSLVQWQSTENDESGASSHNYSGGLKKQSTRKRAPIAPSTLSPAITPRNSKENILRDESGASSHNYSGGLKKQSTRKRAPIAPSTPSPAITPRNSKENIL
ncbi:inaD-like protein, partial [Diaphorina citri]|uniref:InaD-like protein n=1 Tax=Diaphorina citri TaxID=121845 RepID=A0A3Q0JKJ9_DIACI